MLQGVVHALQKHPLAETINEYRPITVYPLPCSLRSSLRAKEVLAHLSHHAPSGIHCNRKQTYATAVWWTMQWAVEFFLYQNAPMSGAILDLVKAFNLLPRDPIFRASAFLKILHEISTAWYGFLNTMTRRFSVRGSLSMAVPSTTGLPTRCALSVRGMKVFDWVLDRWMNVSSLATYRTQVVCWQSCLADSKRWRPPGLCQ